METQNFNFTILHDKFNNVTFNAACDYMTQFFYPLDDGHHGILTSDGPQVIEQAVLNSVYLNRVPESVKKWYYQKYNTIRKLVCNVNAPVITETEFNIAPKMLHTVEDYDTIPDSDKKNVDFMLDYMRTILCNNNEDQFEYLVKWYANMARGK